MLGNIKEVRYGYVIYSKEKMKLEIPLVLELDNIYATKEECLEKAKEEILKCGYDYEEVYVYILPVRQKGIKIKIII